jgi:2-keto-4-pentenoate hydratase/2-oxohepta-3-ene-1,7-dioic acid hydratase in catechol pathway
MRICRFTIGNSSPSHGIIEGDVVYTVEGSLFEEPAAGRRVAPLTEVRLLAPVKPGKIVAVGLNYADHAAEGPYEVPSEPVLFLKPPSAVIGPQAPILLPSQSRRVDHEAELCVTIGRRGRRIAESDALNYVLGYTCGNDVTARDLQRADRQWTRGKGFDTFCPLGPWIETELDPAALEVTGRVNGEVRQQGSTRHMIFPVAALISYISNVMTLEPGDVIMSGTLAGVGPIRSGDVVEIEVSGIGVLSNPVQEA